MIWEMKKYSESHPKFKRALFNSVIDFLNENLYISKNQFNGLRKIYYAFKMDLKK